MAKKTSRRNQPVSTPKETSMSTATVTPPADKSKPKKESYPVAENKDDKIKLELDATEFHPPADWDPEKHRPLGPKHFFDKSHFLVYRALKAEADAAAFRKSAEDWRLHGHTKKAQRKAEQVMKKVTQLRAQLASMGMSDDEIEAMLSAAAGKAEG